MYIAHEWARKSVAAFSSTVSKTVGIVKKSLCLPFLPPDANLSGNAGKKRKFKWENGVISCFLRPPPPPPQIVVRTVHSKEYKWARIRLSFHRISGDRRRCCPNFFFSWLRRLPPRPSPSPPHPPTPPPSPTAAEASRPGAGSTPTSFPGGTSAQESM